MNEVSPFIYHTDRTRIGIAGTYILGSIFNSKATYLNANHQ